MTDDCQCVSIVRYAQDSLCCNFSEKPKLREQNELDFIEIGTLLELLLKVVTDNVFQRD